MPNAFSVCAFFVLDPRVQNPGLQLANAFGVLVFFINEGPIRRLRGSAFRKTPQGI